MQSVHLLNRLIASSLTVGAALTTLQGCIYVVNAGHRAVMFDRFQGIKEESKGEGMHFKIPFIQFPYIYEVRTRYTTIESSTGSKDLQTVKLSLRLLFRPQPEALSTIHKKLGPNYDSKILPSLGNEVLKAVVAQFDAGELITQREHVSKQIRESLTRRAEEFNIILDDVSITHLSFSPEFTSAIEQKQVAQQEAERSKFLVLRAEQEKKAAIIRAEGETEAARLLIQAMKNSPAFLQLRKIETARDVAEILSSSPNVSYLPSNGNILLNVGGGSNLRQK